MNRLLRIFFLCLAAVLAVYAVLQGCDLHAIGYAVLPAKTVWLALAGAMFFGLAAWRFSLRVKFRIFLVILGLALAEGFLQTLGWLGILPGVNTKDRVPYGRVYWSYEGRGNSLRNRYGWHYPEFDLKAPRRIAVIGDSFVEAVEVGRSRNEAAVLQELLRARSSEWAVLGLGAHGTWPAKYMEVLDYAAQHFAPQEAIVCIFLGNDINENSPRFNYAAATHFFFYDLDVNGRLVLLPASALARERFILGMEHCHHPAWIQLPMILKSHSMIVQSLLSVRDNIQRARLLDKLTQADPEATKWGRIGLSLKPFAVTPDPDARHAMDVMLAQLALMKQRCETNRIQLRLITLPFFPPQFYSTQQGSNWTLRIGEYDFLGPDREIAAFAHERGIPFCSLADWLLARKTDVNEIRSLYFFNGVGHFTEKGHRLCAEAMIDTFYKNLHP